MKFIEQQKSRSLIRLGCATLAVLLAVGSASFLRSIAAEEDSVSGSDIVSSGDTVVSAGDMVGVKPYNASVVREGSCGDNATYTLDEDGTLTISGSGTIDNRVQFFDLAITHVVFDADSHITALGSHVFDSLQGIHELTIPDSVTSIGTSAVENCQNLSSVTIGSGVTSIGSRAFYQCLSLENITIPSNVRTIADKAFGLDSNNGPSVGLDGLIDFTGNSLDSGSFTYLTSATTVRIPEGFSIGGTVVTQANKSSFFGSATVIMPGAAEPGMTLNETNLQMYICEGRTDTKHQGFLLTPVFDDDVNDRHVSWSSSDPSVVRVFSNGVVEAMSVGTATVTATSMGGQTAACVCSVTTAELVEYPEQDDLPVHSSNKHPGFVRYENLFTGEVIYCVEHESPSLYVNDLQPELGLVSGRLAYTWRYTGENTNVDIQFSRMNPEYGFEKLEVSVTPTGGTDPGFVEFGTFEPVRKGPNYILPLTIHGAGTASVNIKIYSNGQKNYNGDNYTLIVNDCTFKNPQWDWATDNSSATVTWTYSFDGSVSAPTEAVITREVTQEPTCAAEGSAALTATASDPNGKEWSDQKTETISATGLHNWEWVEDTSATCGAPGVKHEECSVCHAKQKEGTVIPATGSHTWKWITDTEATCEETGVKHEECSVCHQTQSEGTEIEVLGHDWGEWTETTAPSCETEGAETRVCGRDASHTETRPVDAIGHDWNDWVTTTQATCAAPGEKTRTCKNDPSHTETEEIPALSHDWHQWKDVEGQPGMVWRGCVVCGTQETEINPLLQFVVAAGDGQTYTKGSQEPITVKFDKEDIPDLKDGNVYQMFQNGGTIDVTAPDGTVTTLGAGDFTAAEGSLDVTLSAEYLEGLEDGDYTMTVTFVVALGYEKTSAAAAFTVASPVPAGSDSPGTGESIALISVSLALMLLAAYGGIYALSRRRRVIG